MNKLIASIYEIIYILLSLVTLILIYLFLWEKYKSDFLVEMLIIVLVVSAILPLAL